MEAALWEARKRCSWQWSKELREVGHWINSQTGLGTCARVDILPARLGVGLWSPLRRDLPIPANPAPPHAASQQVWLAGLPGGCCSRAKHGRKQRAQLALLLQPVR